MSFRPTPVFAVARFFGIDSWRALGWVSAGAAIVVGLFLVQYSKFGFDRYLGWDTSTVVQMARHIQVFGPFDALTTFRYPYVYVYLNWALGTLAGDVGFGERVLPVLMGMILVALHFRLGRELFPGPRIEYAGLCAWLAALSPNTMILLSGLHRNLFALIAAFSAILVLVELHRGRRSRNSAMVSLVILSALSAYTQFETYAVLLLTVVLYVMVERRNRWQSVGSVALPLLIASPFFLAYLSAYAQYAAVRDPADPALTFSDVTYYHGGLLPLLPLSVLGALFLAREARRPQAAPRLLWNWYVILITLVVALWIVDRGLPALRPLVLVPVPILLVYGIRELSRWFYRLERLVQAGIRTPGNRHSSRGDLVRTLTSSSIALLVILAVGQGLSLQKDLYMQPFISERLHVELKEVGRALEPYSASWPILVFHGLNGTVYHSIERAYVGGLSGPVLAYFGRPQFLLSLTDPLLAEPGLSDEPVPSRYVATQLYQGLGGGEGQLDAGSHAIVVSAPGLYDRPVSDYFVVRHRVSPGLYVVPPGSVTDADRNTWIWFAAYDWRTSLPFNNVTYPWSISPRVLEYTFTSLRQPWSTEYFMRLDHATINTTLSLHLLDTPPFPLEWNILPADAGGFRVYVDNVSVARYDYGYQGVRWVNFSLGSLSTGYHTVRIQAEDVGNPFALALDVLAVYSEGVDLESIVRVYGS